MTFDPAYRDPNTQADRDPLERALAALTAPLRGETDAAEPTGSSSPSLWRSALDSCTPRRASNTPTAPTQETGWERLHRSRKLSRFGVIAASILIGLVMVGMLLPTLGKARSGSVARRVDEPPPRAFGPADAGYSEVPQIDIEAVLAQAKGGSGQSPFVPSGSSASAATPTDTPRYVARKASIDLKTSDVAGAFSKASFLVSDAHGEYIESSSLTGRDDTAAATLLLRVRPDRLSEVLNGLRKLGEVTSETTGGDDVTDRVVDLESRLRNEQRIERELLELIDKRPDAPLKEILDLRAELSKVRGGIETLVAQRDRLGRLVSLATVLVNIRSDASAVAPVTASESILDYLQSRTATTLRRATRALVDSITAILGVLIAGAFWWIVIAIIVVAIVRLRKRAIRRAAHEPPPVG